MTSLTQLLDAHHDKLNEHTADIKDLKTDIATIQTDMEALQASVKGLEKKLADKDEVSGLRAGLRDWLQQMKNLM